MHKRSPHPALKKGAKNILEVLLKKRDLVGSKNLGT
jgi:hypothetical protein